LKTFGKHYEYVAICLDAMANPHVCLDVNEIRWNWDSDINATAQGLKSNRVLGVFWGLHSIE